MEPLGQAPQAVSHWSLPEDSGLGEFQPPPLGRVKQDSEASLGERSSHSLRGKKAILVPSTTPNILLSHSDPVTPGLFSGLGTVDVGKVPLGS